MKYNRFYCDQELGVKDSMLVTPRGLTNQLKNVFRFKKGDKIIVFDNTGVDFLAIINEYEKEGVSLNIIEKHDSSFVPSRDIYLFASIVKKDNFEWIAQKATELGVSHIVPIISTYTEKKAINMDRIQKITIEASEQSGRVTLPKLHEISSLESTMANYSHIKSIAWHTDAPRYTGEDLQDIQGVYIGPEGGWSDADLSLFEKYKVPLRSLGSQVLRSETAVVAVLSKIVFE